MIPSVEGVSLDGPWGSDGPDYAQKICNNGYIWWYLDALSEDKTEGLTLIALIGNYCSPSMPLLAEKERRRPKTIVQLMRFCIVQAANAAYGV